MEQAIDDLVKSQGSPKVLVSVVFNESIAKSTTIQIDSMIKSMYIYKDMLMDYLGIMFYDLCRDYIDIGQETVLMIVDGMEIEIKLKLPNSHYDTVVTKVLSYSDRELELVLYNSFCCHARHQATDKEQLTACVALGIVKSLKNGSPMYCPGDPVYITA